MTLFDLTEGQHTIAFSLGNTTMIATIQISASGTITCTGVQGGTCGSSSQGITISGLTITGYMSATATPTPTTTPTPAPGATVCTWTTGKGGWRNITQAHIIELVSAYAGQVNPGFTVRQSHIMGAVAYYSQKQSGLPGNGNALTGCTFT